MTTEHPSKFFFERLVYGCYALSLTFPAIKHDTFKKSIAVSYWELDIVAIDTLNKVVVLKS